MTFRYRTLYQLSYNGPTYSLAHNAAGRELFVKNNRARPALCAQKTNKTLVDREGFEPSYLARRDRFTVCWL
jgi:hypothetical protein